jgi:antitoxin component of RelBE/YafQ-DinJ toxin-antitoxin module
MKTRRNFTIDDEVYDQVQVICKKIGISASAFIALALVDLIHKHKTREHYFSTSGKVVE